MTKKLPEDKRVWFDEEDPTELAKAKAAKIGKIESRRSKVYDLYFFRNHTQQAIAKILTVHVQTVKNDIKALKAEAAHSVSDSTQKELVGEIIQRYKNIISEAWYNYNSLNDPKQSSVKFKYMELAKNTQKDLSAFMLEVGVIPKANSRGKSLVSDKDLDEMSDVELDNIEAEYIEKFKKLIDGAELIDGE